MPCLSGRSGPTLARLFHPTLPSTQEQSGSHFTKPSEGPHFKGPLPSWRNKLPLHFQGSVLPLPPSSLAAPSLRVSPSLFTSDQAPLSLSITASTLSEISISLCRETSHGARGRKSYVTGTQVSACMAADFMNGPGSSKCMPSASPLLPSTTKGLRG